MLISTIMKSGNFKGASKQKNVEIIFLDVFNKALNKELQIIGNNNPYTLFEEKFLYFLNKQAPLKN